jgi:hypothetical protein
VDVAGWYRDVTRTAIEKQRRWWCIYQFFSFIVSFTYLSFVFYHQAYLVCLVKNSSYFPRVFYLTSLSFFFCITCTWLWFKGVLMRKKKIIYVDINIVKGE